MNWLYRILSGLLSAFAVVSLAQRILEVGLSPILHDTLQAYRDLIYPLSSLLLSWVHLIVPDWEIPSFLKDLLALSFLGAAAFDRANEGHVRASSTHPRGIAHIFARTLLVIAIGVTMLGLLVIAFVPVAALNLLTASSNDPRREIWGLRELVVAFAGGALGAAAFFALNGVT